MKRSLETTVEVVLKLTVEEAEWLHDRMQNPSEPVESTRDEKMRKLFFECTTIPKLAEGRLP